MNKTDIHHSYLLFLLRLLISLFLKTIIIYISVETVTPLLLKYNIFCMIKDYIRL